MVKNLPPLVPSAASPSAALAAEERREKGRMGEKVASDAMAPTLLLDRGSALRLEASLIALAAAAAVLRLELTVGVVAEKARGSRILLLVVSAEEELSSGLSHLSHQSQSPHSTPRTVPLVPQLIPLASCEVRFRFALRLGSRSKARERSETMKHSALCSEDFLDQKANALRRNTAILGQVRPTLLPFPPTRRKPRTH